jgi:hypothetical protein
MPRFLNRLSTLFEVNNEDDDKFTPLPSRLNKKRRSMVPADDYKWPSPTILSPRIISYNLYDDDEDQDMPLTQAIRKVHELINLRQQQSASYAQEQSPEIAQISAMFYDESEVEHITFNGEVAYESTAMDEEEVESPSISFYRLDEDTSFDSMPSLVRTDASTIDSASIYTNSDEVDFFDETPAACDEVLAASFPLDWKDLEATSVGKIQQWPGTPLVAAAPLPAVKFIQASVLVPVQLPTFYPIETLAVESVSAPIKPVNVLKAVPSCRRCLHLAHKNGQSSSGNDARCERCKPAGPLIVHHPTFASMNIPIANAVESKSSLKSKLSHFLRRSNTKGSNKGRSTHTPMKCAVISSPIPTPTVYAEISYRIPVASIYSDSSNRPIPAPSMFSKSTYPYLAASCYSESKYPTPSVYSTSQDSSLQAHRKEAPLLPRSRSQLHQAHKRVQQQRRLEEEHLERSIAKLSAFVDPTLTRQYTIYGEAMTTI